MIYGPKKNTAFTFYLPLVTKGATDWKDAPTLAAGDVKVKKDAGALANSTTLPALDAAGEKVVKVTLSATEMNADVVVVRFIDQTDPKEWEDTGIVIITTAQGVGLQSGDAYARLGAPAGASVSADVAAVKGDTAAILVDTGTTLDGRIPAALVGGRIDASVGAVAANAITAAAIATDAIDADSLKADAIAEIQAGLSTLTAQQVWEYGARSLTTFGTLVADAAAAVWASVARTLTANPGLTAAQVNAEVDTALADYDAPTRAEATADKEAVIAALPAAPNNAGIAVAAAAADAAAASSAAVNARLPAVPASQGDVGVVLAAAGEALTEARLARQILANDLYILDGSDPDVAGGTAGEKYLVVYDDDGVTPLKVWLLKNRLGETVALQGPGPVSRETAL